jgi:hypothetical protein
MALSRLPAKLLKGVYPSMLGATAMLVVGGILLTACAAPINEVLPTPATSPTIVFVLTATVAPTFIPSPFPSPTATPMPALLPTGVVTPTYDCSVVERIPPDSPEAQRIVQEFVTNFKARYPTEYMAIEELWAVDRMGEYAAIQGLVTTEESDVFVVEQTLQGFQMVARLGVTVPLRSRYVIPEYFVEQLPGVPPVLFYCLDVSRFVDDVPAQELDLERDYDCSLIEQVPVDSPRGQAVNQAILAFMKDPHQPYRIRVGEVHSIARQGNYTMVQVSFVTNGREPPSLLVFEETPQGYQTVAYYSGPTGNRSGFLRQLYAEFPGLPVELLTCIDLRWFYSPLTPASTLDPS